MTQQIYAWVASIRPVGGVALFVAAASLAGCAGGADGSTAGAIPGGESLYHRHRWFSSPSPQPSPSSSASPAGASSASPVPTSRPTTAPVPSTTPAPISAGGEFLGCPYPSGDVWQADISSASITATSAQNIQATIDGGDTGGFNVWLPDQETINTAAVATALLAVAPQVSYHTPYSPVPWLASFSISSLSDHHAMVLQTQSCQYFEYYEMTYNGALSAYNGGMWSLAKPFSRPASGAVSTASGIPIGLLAVRPEELAAGAIQHALGWGAVAHSVSQSACVSPAGMTDCTDNLAYSGPSTEAALAMPYGAHIRLKSSFDDSTFPREAYIVAEALKHYGAYLYDTGCCDEIPFANDQYGAPTWTSLDSAAINSIGIGDFDVVQAP
jgi:hypothetical protein